MNRSDITDDFMQSCITETLSFDHTTYVSKLQRVCNIEKCNAVFYRQALQHEGFCLEMHNAYYKVRGHSRMLYMNVFFHLLILDPERTMYDWDTFRYIIFSLLLVEHKQRLIHILSLDKITNSEDKVWLDYHMYRFGEVCGKIKKRFYVEKIPVLLSDDTIVGNKRKNIDDGGDCDATPKRKKVEEDEAIHEYNFEFEGNNIMESENENDLEFDDTLWMQYDENQVEDHVHEILPEPGINGGDDNDLEYNKEKEKEGHLLNVSYTISSVSDIEKLKYHLIELLHQRKKAMVCNLTDYDDYCFWMNKQRQQHSK